MEYIRYRIERSLSWVVFALMLATSATFAQSRAVSTTGCLDVMQITGSNAEVARTREVLNGADFNSISTSLCRDLRLQVTSTVDRWHYTLRQGEHIVERDVEEPEAIVPWLESWLAPTEDAPAAEAAPAPSNVHASTHAFAESSAASVERALPMQLALRAALDLDDRGPLWPGAELAFRVGLNQRLWLGIAAAGAWASRANEQRNVQRLSVRLGQAQTFSWGSWSFGGGVGLATARAKKSTPTDGVLRDEEAHVFVEAITGFDVPLGGAWHMSSALLLRGYVPDDFKPDSPEAVSEPKPLAAFSLGAQVGLGWNL